MSEAKMSEAELLAEGERLLVRMANSDCERAKRRYDRGDKGAVLDAVFACAGWIPLPEWAAVAFRGAYLEVKVHLRQRSWDGVFGMPHEKNAKLPARRQRQEKLWLVWVRVTDLRKEQPRKNHFPKVAEGLGISAGEAKKYYYAAEKFVRSPEPRMAEYARRRAEEAREASKNLKSK